jgi:hypothetical protein
LGRRLDLYSTYDQYVDVVSCWEAFLGFSYRGRYESFFFDRFPKIPMQGKELTPDFTAFFTEEYAMIFEISRTFPMSDEGLSKEMNQLLRYDFDILVFNGKRHVEVDSYDIVLLLGSLDSFEIAHRIVQYLERKEIKFNHNFIIMEYNSNFLDSHPYYYFRKIPSVNSTFTDFFPEGVSIFRQVDEDFKSIRVKIDDMKEYKINGVLCNDDPPPAYLAGYIWHKILYEYTSEEQREIWREKNPGMAVPLRVGRDDLKNRVEESIRNGRMKETWISVALDFLVDCELATKESEKEYEIRFRNLYPLLKETYDSEPILKRDLGRGLAEIFIERYCKKKFKAQERAEKDVDQMRLDQFS